MDKYKIEKNTVQETLVIPLYGRRLCSRMFPTLFQDESAAELIERIDYDFLELEKQSDSLMQVFGALEVAMRQSDLAWEVGDYLKAHPKAAIINLGCGLDNTGRACDNGACKIYNIDLPDVTQLRNHLLPAEARERNLALKEYARIYGPLTVDTAEDICTDRWNWINEPWPWQEGGC